ncbi:MAG: hypothetical protein ACL93V_07830 [Candidatus Electrothrix sp. YB6]
MYGFLVLPFLITIGISILLVNLLPRVHKILKLKKQISFGKSVLLVIILFVPSCIGVMEIVDSIRYGTFTYNKHMEVDGRRIRNWMPPKATNIVVHKTSYGHFAKFTIEKKC